MKISDRIHLIASGLLGCSLTHDSDCNVYAIDCGGEFVVVDSGCGIETDRLIANLKTDGIRLDSVGMLVLTHGHLDHSGGTRRLRDRLHLKGGRRDLFCGDTVFHGGRILLQDVADCDIPAYSQTLRRLAALEFDGFYPGHLIWSEQRGRRHLEKAREYLDRLLLPPNIL